MKHIFEEVDESIRQDSAGDLVGRRIPSLSMAPSRLVIAAVAGTRFVIAPRAEAARAARALS